MVLNVLILTSIADLFLFTSCTNFSYFQMKQRLFSLFFVKIKSNNLWLIGVKCMIDT